MRILFRILSALSAFALVSCAHHRGQSLSWTGRTILPSHESVSQLNDTASNSALSQNKRAEAIFTLFARHILPGSSAAEVRRTLTRTNWLDDVNLYGVYAGGGWVPVETTFEDTVFCVQLFPVEKDKQWSPWAVYFRLSGGGGRPREDAIAFLRGDMALHGKPKLVEFALCFPSDPAYPYGPPTGTRIERFSRRGVHVYGLE